jgi:hypothetical protein
MKNNFHFYPEITDSEFNEKIYSKKEFRDNEIKENVHLNFDVNKNLSLLKEFELEPHQVFLNTYISPDTPYNGILVFHGTGVGKTCSAISIAEGFKKTLKNLNKKILIISNLEKNFRNEIYNEEKELLKIKKNQQFNVQCTGKSYELGEESLYLTKEQKKKEIYKLIKSYYQFTTYIKLANDIKEKTGGWKGEDINVDNKIKEFISQEFNDRVIIIDEIQNIKTDKNQELSRIIQPILQAIIKYGKNIKLILMSATPMFDRSDEIIFYLNLLLENDKRPLLNKNEIFNSKDGTLKPNAENILQQAMKGYISYMRSEKPFIFPFRLNPKNSVVPTTEYYISGKKIDDKYKIKYTKIISLPMKSIQENTYIYHLKNKINLNTLKELDLKDIDYEDYNIEDDINYVNDINNTSDSNLNNNKNIIRRRIHFDLNYISNIIFPIANKKNGIDKIGNFGKQCIETTVDNGLGGFYKVINTDRSKRIVKYRYQKHAIFDLNTKNEAPFTDEKYIENFSIKFSSIFKSIKHSKGLVFIFSHFIEQGTLPLALMLEQNGFARSCANGEADLLEYNPNKLKGGGKRQPICYRCGEEFKNIQHHNQELSNFHHFKQAKYILFFGESRDIIKINKNDALNKFTSSNNIYGEEIKVFIGTRAVSEGLNFKRIRQVHIIDPWYNLSRHEQIIGRAIRNSSHDNLPSEERNVEIYQYASILDNKNEKDLTKRESINLTHYRIAENKDIIIKKINRMMKEAAVDCVLFKKANIVESNKKVKQVNSNGDIIEVTIADKPYTPLCDYEKNCDYKCTWEPNPRIKYPVNNDTYNIRFAYNDIQKAKKIIKELFKKNIVYDLKTIEYFILQKIPELNKLFIYSALEDVVNNKNEIVLNKFNIKGYIIYRGDYYVFQPFDLDREEIPYIYRMYPMDIKKNSIDLEDYDFEYNNNKNKKNISELKINEDSIILKILEDIQNIYNLHKNIFEKKYEKEYIYSVFGTIFDKTIFENQIIFIKNILKKYFQENRIQFIQEIIYYLNKNHILINYNNDIKGDVSSKKDNKIVGFVINEKYYVLKEINKDKNIKSINLNNLDFELANNNIINKIKTFRQIYIKKNKLKNQEFNNVYGYIEISKNNKIKKFKIVDKTIQQEIRTKQGSVSKRAQITGRECSTYKMNELLEIRIKMNMYKIDTKRKIQFICNDIEIFLRYKQFIDSGNIIWFENKY